MRATRQLFLLAFASMVLGCSPALDWREYRPPAGGFSILLPQKPGQAERDLSTPAGTARMRMVSARVGAHVFAAGYADFAAPPPSALLDGLRDALVRNIGGKIDSERAIDLRAGPAREFMATGTLGQGKNAQPARMHARLFIRERRYFQLVSLGPAGAMADADIELFLGSFKAD